MNNSFSLLHSAVVRELPIALAHAFAVAKMGDFDRCMVLNRLFARMTPGDKLRCTAELRECRAAQRGGRLAVVS